MTKRQFAAKIIKEHLMGQFDHSKNAWGHNFNHLYGEKGDHSYLAISLVLEYYPKDEDSVTKLLTWFQMKEPLTTPFCIPEKTKNLLWNLYYSFKED